MPLVNNKWDIEGAVGDNGLLNVIKNFDEEKNFSSQVSVSSGDIASVFARYFFDSEQLPTILNLNVELDNNGGVKNAKGYVIQLMTGYEEEDVVFLENLTLSNLDKNIDECINEMFDDFKRLENTPVKFVCDCSKSKFEKGLVSLNKDELKQILEEDGKIEAVCNFCSESYLFNEEEIKRIIEE